jgi:hypothetical protein
MSYCRFSDADIYVFAASDGFQCYGCPDDKYFSTPDAPVMIHHMKQHRDAGLDVPDYAIAGVWDDRHLYTTGPQE